MGQLLKGLKWDAQESKSSSFLQVLLLCNVRVRLCYRNFLSPHFLLSHECSHRTAWLGQGKKPRLICSFCSLYKDFDGDSFDLIYSYKDYVILNYHIFPILSQTHILDRMAWIVFLRSSVKHRQRTAEEFKKEAEQFRSRFGGKTYHKITIGLNLFVDNSLKEFETFWRREEWRLVSLVLERFFTYVLLFSVLISFFVFAATVR